MSFRRNYCQQLSITDKFTNLTPREQKAVRNSWAEVFAEEIFPAIDEKPFSALYSDKPSRPNTPVNVIVGALIIKELFDLSDDEVVENLMLDPRYQYALRTTSFEEQPLSDKSLTRFRQRCYEYERKTGIALYENCVKDLSGKIAKLMHISGRIRRMDSMMVEANIRKLSRAELIYRCLAKLLKYVARNSPEMRLPENLKRYLDENDFNKTFYYEPSSKNGETLARLLEDCDALLALCGSAYAGIEEYELFARCLDEQTVAENGKRRLRTKEDGGMNSGILQNPSDPEATYRKKASKEHRGYALNIEESVDANGSVITDYQFEANNYSDSKFLSDYIERTDKQEEKVTLVADGAYCGSENSKAAAKKNIEIVTTELSGRKTSDIKADFCLPEEGEEGSKSEISCPCGNVPKKWSLSKSNNQYSLSFDRECCAGCPNKEKCGAKIYKRVAKVSVSKSEQSRAAAQRSRKTVKFKLLSRIRNGVETVPSVLRKVFGIDKLPRGLIAGRFFVSSKIAALNFRKLFAKLSERGHYARNPLLA